jgi:hypothetical protein
MYNTLSQVVKDVGIHELLGMIHYVSFGGLLAQANVERN